MRLSITIIIFVLFGCSRSVAEYNNSTDLAIFIFTIEAKIYNKTMQAGDLDSLIPDGKNYCILGGKEISGLDIKRTILYDIGNIKIETKVNEICSFRTETEVFRFHIVEK